MWFSIYGNETHRLSIDIDTSTFTFVRHWKIDLKKHLNENISQIILPVLNRLHASITGFIFKKKLILNHNHDRVNFNMHFNFIVTSLTY